MIKFVTGFLLLFCLGAQAFELKGEVKSLKTKEVIYFEHHTVTTDDEGYNKLIQTEYTKPDGKVFAKMTTDFTKDRYLPDISYEDLRFDLKEQLTFDKEKKKIRLLKKIQDKITTEKEFRVEMNMLAGQGFDNFIKAHFDDKGKKKTLLHFVVLTRMDHYKFFLSPEATKDSPTKTFGLTPSNFVLKLFAEEIQLQYDPKTKRLLSYRGLSNIADDKNEPQNISVEYTEVSH